MAVQVMDMSQMHQISLQLQLADKTITAHRANSTGGYCLLYSNWAEVIHDLFHEFEIAFAADGEVSVSNGGKLK